MKSLFIALIGSIALTNSALAWQPSLWGALTPTVVVNIEVAEENTPIPDDRGQKATEFFDHIKDGVERKDYLWIAKQFKYPICVEMNCREVRVNTPQELLKYQDQIFTENIRQVVLDQTRDNLFEKYESYMIGQGEIWFDPFNGIHDVANNEGYSVIDCSNIAPKPLPEKYYGKWEVYRAEVIGGSMSDDIIHDAIGNHIIIKKDEFLNETKLLIPSQKGVEWLITETPFSKDGDFEKCTLGWYAMPEALPDKLVQIFACADGQKHLYLEVTNNDELAYFYDGHFIFLKRSKDLK